MLQWYDGNVSGEWINFNAVNSIGGTTTGSAGVNSGTTGTGFEFFISDGVNFRIANLSGAAWAALVTAAGSGYVQATTTATAGTGNSTWTPIVGGSLGTFTVGTAGSGYTIPPLVLLPAPPAPGVAATAYATLSTGTVSAITIDIAGAGYLTAPPVTIIPSPWDPAFLAGSIKPAAATVALAGSGTVTAVLLNNFGQPLGAGPTITINGAGTSATVATVPASGSWVAAATARVFLQQMP
jgi:hypothetical protein